MRESKICLAAASKDPLETTDVAAQHPDVVARLSAIAREQRVPAKLWPIPALDKTP